MNRKYRDANVAWLKAKSNEEGVQALDKGIYYKVLKNGDPNSARPGPRSIVSVHYTGRTIDGRVFDSNEGEVPMAMRLSDLIEGWAVALQQMHIGDKWEIYIPSELGYGKLQQSGIPGHSTLVFEIELFHID